MTIKLFFVILSIAFSLKNVIIPLEKFDRVKTLELFGKAYELLPNQPADKEKFLITVDKWLSLYISIINIFWEFNPTFFHNLAWRVVGAKQEAWLSIVDKVQENLKTYFIIDDELNQKMNDYIHEYNLKVLAALTQKDFETQVRKFDNQFQNIVAKEIEKFKQKMSHGEPPGDWLFYVDGYGIHYR